MVRRGVDLYTTPLLSFKMEQKEVKKLLLIENLTLECGKHLSKMELAYQTYGVLNAQKDNVVWVCHALTANADVLNWWNPLFEGEEPAFPLADYFVICVNVLGSCYGTTGPLSINPKTDAPYFHCFPELTIRDLVEVHKAVANELKINKISFLIGASLGGQQALEWAIEEANRFENLIVLATNAKHSSWGIAFNESQRMAIETDPSWPMKKSTAGLQGMKVARSIALLSYRSHNAYVSSQVDRADEKKNFKAITYQRYQGEKLAKRFNAFSYHVLSRAMDSHNVGRNRSSVSVALSKIRARTLVIGIDSDLLFPLKEQRYLARHILHAKLKIHHSPYGHDGFLVEANKLSKLIAEEFQPRLATI